MKEGTLIVFVKAPEAGRVKTRLAREVGAGRAATIFRHLLARTLKEARGPWRTIIAVEPAAAIRRWDHLWPDDFYLLAQGPGDLGARLLAAMAAAGPGPIVMIGADAPAMRAHHVRHAFRALARRDAVLGPASDGGYWLIGLAQRRRAPDLFDGVRWSTKHALKDTRKSLPKDFSVAELETLVDIDEAKDLAAIRPASAARG